MQLFFSAPGSFAICVCFCRRGLALVATFLRITDLPCSPSCSILHEHPSSAVVQQLWQCLSVLCYLTESQDWYPVRRILWLLPFLSSLISFPKLYPVGGGGAFLRASFLPFLLFPIFCHWVSLAPIVQVLVLVEVAFPEWSSLVLLSISVFVYLSLVFSGINGAIMLSFSHSFIHSFSPAHCVVLFI